MTAQIVLPREVLGSADGTVIKRPFSLNGDDIIWVCDKDEWVPFRLEDQPRQGAPSALLTPGLVTLWGACPRHGAGGCVKQPPCPHPLGAGSAPVVRTTDVPDV